MQTKTQFYILTLLMLMSGLLIGNSEDAAAQSRISSSNGQSFPSDTQPGQTGNFSGKHSIDIEIFGFSMPYSLGYSYQLNEKWSLRAGFGYFDVKSGETKPEILEKYGESFIKATNIPMKVSRFMGRSNHKLELQGGISLIYFNSSTLFDFSPKDAGWSVSPVVGAAYSYQGERFVAGAGLTAGIASWTVDNNLLILPGFRWGIRL